MCVRVCEREKEVGIFSYVLWMSPKKHQQERLRGLQLAPGLRAGTRVGPAAPPLTPSSRGGCCLLRVFTPMLSSPQQKVSLRTHPYNLLFQACVNTAQNTHTHTHTHCWDTETFPLTYPCCEPRTKSLPSVKEDAGPKSLRSPRWAIRAVSRSGI